MKCFANEEVKNIIEYLEDKDMYIEHEGSGYCYKRLSLDESIILIDYIKDLQTRIDKAVKYINEKENVSLDLKEWLYLDLLDILRGEE